MRELPHPEDLINAHSWLRQGCPMVSRDIDTLKARKTLMALLDALPSHIPVYCYGTSENVEAYRKLNEERK